MRILGFLLFFLLSNLLSNTLLADPFYVGNRGCSTCHKKEILDWSLSAHGKAFESLKPGVKKLEKKRASLEPDKDYTSDRKCLKCHTIGYQQKGGFIDLATTPELIGIGCEMCHGPGSEYRRLHDEKKSSFTLEEAKAAGQIYGSIERDVCAVCHAHKDTPLTEKVHEKYRFVWKEALAKRRSYHQKHASDFSF